MVKAHPFGIFFLLSLLYACVDTSKDNNQSAITTTQPPAKGSFNPKCETIELKQAGENTSQLLLKIKTKVNPCSVYGYVMGYHEDLPIQVTSTGDYLIDAIPPGVHDILIVAKSADNKSAKPNLGLRLNQQQFLPGSRKTKQNIELSALGALTGRVLLEDAVDHSGVLISIPGTHFQGESTTEGQFTIEGIPAGDHDLSLTSPLYYDGLLKSYAILAAGDHKLNDFKLIKSMGLEQRMLIDSSEGVAGSSFVNVITSIPQEAVAMKLSSSADFDNLAWEPIRSNKLFDLASEGEHTVYLKFKLSDDLESDVFSQSIRVDLSPPSGSMSLQQEALAINSLTAQLNFSLDDWSQITQMKISDKNTLDDIAWQDYQEAFSFTFPSFENDQTLYAIVKDQWGYTSEVFELPLKFDDVQPSITSTSVLDQDYRVDITDDIVIEFSEDVLAASIDSDSVVLEQAGQKLELQLNLAGSTLTIIPAQTLQHATDYRLILTNDITDLALNSLESTLDLSFRTEHGLANTVNTISTSVDSTFSLDFNHQGQGFLVWDSDEDLVMSNYADLNWDTGEVFASGDGNVNGLFAQVNNSGNKICIRQQYSAESDLINLSPLSGDIYALSFNQENSTWSSPTTLDNITGHNTFPEPKGLYFNEDSHALAIWAEDSSSPKNIKARLYDGNQWISEANIESFSNDTTDPIGGLNSSGDAFVAWIQNDSGTKNLYVNSYSASNSTWAGAFLVDNSVKNVEEITGFIASDGSITLAWNQSDQSTERIYSRTYDSTNQSWGSIESVDAGDQTIITNIHLSYSTISNNAYLTWINEESGTYKIHSSRHQLQWSAPDVLTTLEGYHNKPEQLQVISGEDGAIVIWKQSSQNASEPDMIASYFDAQHLYWTSSTLIDELDSPVSSIQGSWDQTNQKFHLVWTQGANNELGIYSRTFK